MGNALPFELTEEAFTGSVVAAMPNGTHAADQRVANQKARVVCTGKLGGFNRSLQDRIVEQILDTYSELQRVGEVGINPSVGNTGDAYDNALAETINGLYKDEVIHNAAPGRPRLSSNWPHWNGWPGSITAAAGVDWGHPAGRG